MPIPQACLRARLLTARVAARRLSALAMPSRAAQGRNAKGSRPAKERPGYGAREYSTRIPRGRREQNTLKFWGEVNGKEGDSLAASIRTTVSRLQSGEISIAEAWAYLEDEILPDAKKGGNVAPAVRTLVEAIMGMRRANVGDPVDGPSLSKLMDLYVVTGKSRNRRPVMRLLHASLEYLVEGTASEEQTKAVLGDVVALWVGLFQLSKYMGPDGIQLPSLRYRKMQELARGPEPFSAVAGAALMPSTSPEPLQRATAALLATYVLAEERGLRSSDLLKPIAPLLSFTERLMDALWTGPDDALAEFAAGDQPDALRDYVAARLDRLQSRPTPALSPEYLHRLLSRGLKTRDVEHTQRTWTSLTEQIQTLAPRFEADPALRERYAGLLDFCVCIWCALGHQDIQAVLHYMEAHGFAYTLKTYTSMIEGWKLARRPQNIALLWERLVRDGVPLDAVIWSARISALMTCGLEKPAVRALFEMGTLWDAAVKEGGGARGGAVKPEIGPVNAALAGVLRSKGVGAAPAILSWAAKYDVEPDLATHNMLLRAMLHEGRGPEADALLRDMRQRGVAADAATFTIIVEEVLGAAAGEAEEKRLEAVRGIFAAIEASGQSAKAATYAKMVHVLLEIPPAGEGNRAEGPAVREVLAHMRRRGVEPTSHLFTILARHHLARGDIPAVRDMIASRGLSGSDRVDGVFWEVAIRGFAGAGCAGEARGMFFGLRRETRVSLGVLDQLLVALLEGGDVEGARGFVREVKARMAEGGVAGDGGEGRERFMKHRFWHVVAKHGLDVE